MERGGSFEGCGHIWGTPPCVFSIKVGFLKGEEPKLKHTPPKTQHPKTIRGRHDAVPPLPPIF